METLVLVDEPTSCFCLFLFIFIFLTTSLSHFQKFKSQIGLNCLWIAETEDGLLSFVGNDER